MNQRLQTLLAEAEVLPVAEQERLADLVESFVATHAAADLFTPEELDDLERLAAEPFERADPAEVAALLVRYGQG